MTSRNDAAPPGAPSHVPLFKRGGMLGDAGHDASLALHRWKGAIWVLAFAVAFGLGFWGWRVNDIQDHEGGLVDDAFRTIQLLTLRGQGIASAKLPWQLNVARFLLPALALLGSYRLFIASIRSPARLATLGLRHGHVILVPGRGDAGEALLDEARNSGIRAVAVVPALKVEDRARIEERGMAVLSADPFVESTWHQARADRADMIVVAAGHDVENLNIAVTVADALRHRKEPGKPTLLVAVNDELLAEQLDVALDNATRRSGLRYRRLSVPEEAARRLLLEPPLASLKPDRRRRSHILILGLGPGARAVLHQALMLAQDTAGAVPRITVLAAEKELAAEPLLRPGAMPDFVASLVGIACDWSGGLPLAVLVPLMTDDDPVVLACVCMADDAGIACGLALARQATLQGWPDFTIAVHEQREDRFLGLLARENAIAGHGRLRPFGGLLPSGTLRRFLNESRDGLPQAIHAHYLDLQRRNGATDGTQESWEDLSENIRHANRAAAEHIAVKLAAIGCRIVDGNAPPFAFSDAEVEALARIEHRRWCAERLAQGWRLGARDNKQRLHPDLVAFDDLAESGRDKDRDAVRSLPAILARAGKSIRREPPAVALRKSSTEHAGAGGIAAAS